MSNVFDEMDMLMHYGMPRRSGRYPWGSGEDPYQRTGDFISRVKQMRKDGFEFVDENGKKYTGDTAIAKSFNMSTTEFRTKYSMAKDERRALEVDTAKGLREKGYSLNEIARKMGYANDSSIRSLLNESSASRMNAAKETAAFLRDQIAKKGMIDVGSNVEMELGVSRQKFDEALEILKTEGYPVYNRRLEQVTNRHNWTILKIVGPPGTEYKDTYDTSKIDSLTDYISYDKGKTFETFQYPASMDSKRLKVRFAEEGGIDKDGLVEIRRGVPDLDMGKSRYSQVRILVDGSRYIKGMAVYGDDKDFPPGVDVIFNSNKAADVGKLGALKKIKDDPTNPFGSLIKEHGGQSYYEDADGNKKLSLINKRAEEGDWSDWANKVPAQFLSKQNKSLINSQLKMTIDDKKFEYDEICSLTNPTVKKALLETFANDCDSAAVHLKAAALPRQAYKVIIPLTSIKDNEVYAPHLENGETVALVRYPHGGTFEIPVLTVNNNIKEGKRYLTSTPADAIGINSKVASQLSGADFDGDTVMCIPTGNNGINISHKRPLTQLKGFDPTMNYGPDNDDPVKVDSKTGAKYYSRNGHVYQQMRNTENEMGKISNLITDMTLKGATPDELARAVKHSMVVIDAEKHHLDYKTSEKDNDIGSLKKKYQKHVDEDGNEKYGGASTLISLSKSRQPVYKTQGAPRINQKGKPWYDPDLPEGALIQKHVYETYVDKHGKTKYRMQDSTKMAETRDAYTLVSEMNTPAERAYAEYANTMKQMANDARKEMVYTGKIEYSKAAYETYKDTADSLKSRLFIAEKNAPRERKAQMMATIVVDAKIQSNPDMTKKEIKKASQQALVDARIKVDAKRHPITITDDDWTAIQAGAISENQLSKIMKYADMDSLRERATPRAKTSLSSSKVSHIQALKASGYTTAQIADKLGVSTSTVTKYLSGKE